MVFAMRHRTVSPVSSVHLELFKKRNNWDKGQERLGLLSVSAECRHFGNKTLNALNCQKVLNTGHSFHEHLYICRMKYGLKYGLEELD